MKPSVLIALALLFAALPALTAGPDPAETSASPPPELDVNRAELADPPTAEMNAAVTLFRSDPAEPPVPGRPLSPLMVEINRLIGEERAAAEVLHARFSAAPDEAAALSIQREIETLARDTELKILQVQADFARAEGREEQALEIDRWVAQMKEPVRRGVPRDRAEPADRK